MLVIITYYYSERQLFMLNMHQTVVIQTKSNLGCGLRNLWTSTSLSWLVIL